MGTRFHSWQKTIKIHPVRSVLMILLAIVIVLVILCILGYIFNWGWSGLNATDFTSTPQNITRTVAYQPGKTLWDWLQLLIIPAVLAVAGYVINLTISRGEQAVTEQRAKTEREIALDIQREAALKDYIDKMAELLLHENLRQSKEDAEVRTIARVSTLTVLPRLDGIRKGSVIQFLYESKLIDQDNSIISLEGANLREVNLFSFDLTGANLYKADLFKADLRGSILKKANLIEANLGEAKLSGADLSEASLYQAKLIGANLTRTNLIKANLIGAILSKAELYGVFLVEAQLNRADLTRSNLTGAQLGGTILKDANLCNSILREVNFIMANLGGADLSGVDLYGAKVSKKQLDQAKSVEGITLQDGSKLQ